VNAEQIVIRRRVAEHEARHAASCMLLGGTVRKITIVVDGARIEGTSSQVDPDRVAHMVSVMAPYIDEAGVPSWTDVQYPESPDERLISDAVKKVGLSEARYGDVTRLAHSLVAEAAYDRLRNAIAHALEYTDYLGGEDVHTIFNIATGEDVPA
jgi:hypothetical protein